MSREDASWIWTDQEGLGRNRYALFRSTFELDGEPAEGELCIFADTRYRLTVNGVTVGHGPARFFVDHPRYDIYDLGPYLRAGTNALAVTVNSYGCMTFHCEYSIGGLIAWGRAGTAGGRTVDIATGAHWKAVESPGHMRETSKLSFALNPGELLDARRMPEGWTAPEFDDSQWPQTVPVAGQDHWGELRPRRIPLLDEREVWARRRIATARAALPADEKLYSFCLPQQGRDRNADRSPPAVAMTFLHSPRAQKVTMGAFWGEYWLNGRALEPRPCPDLRLRQDFDLDLKQGWNTLVVCANLSYDAWVFYMSLPRQAGIELSAGPDKGLPDVFLIAGPWPGESNVPDRLGLPFNSPADLPDEFGEWQRWPRGRGADAAYMERAWKTFQPLDEDSGEVRVRGDFYSHRLEGDSLVLLYDFGGEVLGRPLLEFTAAAGTTIDLSYSEKLGRNGMPADLDAHHVRMSERYIARGGRQRLHTFHPRGFRYLEVQVSGDTDDFELDKVALTRALYPARQVGSFACSDPLLNRIWQVGVDTLHACMEDGYLDCPRRERGCYVGDMLVEFFSNLACFGDHDLMRHTLRLFLESQGPQGLVAPCPHGLSPQRHPDYSALVVQCLWLYYARTGDEEFLAAMQGRLMKLAEGIAALKMPDGELYDGSDLSPYIDRQRMDREGVNCALNCFYQRAFADTARIMDVLGDGARAAEYRGRAQRLAQAIRAEFWDAERQVFVDRRLREVPDTGPSVASNTLPMLYDIADAEQVAGPLEYVTAAVLDNFSDEIPPRRDNECNVMPYFSFYTAGALYKHGRAAQAAEFFRQSWGMMLEHGAWTWWEAFTGGSACHAWSSCPTHYLSTQALGVQFPEPGNPNRVHIAPTPGTLQWAEGTYPHPAGLIHVRWEIKDGTVLLDVVAPDEVELSLAEEVDWTGS